MNDQFDEFIGEELTIVTEQNIRKISGEDLRIWRPGTIGTMDYKPFRVNVYVNDARIITKIAKG